MSSALLDTDILSEVLKRRDPVVVAEAERYLAREHRPSSQRVPEPSPDV